MVRDLIIRFLAGILMLAGGALVIVTVGSVSPGTLDVYKNVGALQPGSGPAVQILWIVPFVFAFILFWLWGFTKRLFRGSNYIARGFVFGFLYWLTTLPLFVMVYSLSQSFGIVFGWTLAVLFDSVIAGILFARLRP